MKGKMVLGSKKGFAGIAVFFVLALLVSGTVAYYAYTSNPQPVERLEKFGSCNAITDKLKDIQTRTQNYYALQGGLMRTFGAVGAPMAMAENAAKDSSANGAGTGGGGVAYSETNVQVEGVDEADIVKTDGQYIYTITTSYGYYGNQNSTLVIAKAYPADEAAILSELDLGEFYPQEMFIQSNHVLIFGSTNKQIPLTEEEMAASGGSGSSGSSGSAAPDSPTAEKMIAPPYYQPYRYIQLATVRIYDVADKANPSLVRSVDFEGNYLSSRKIGSYVYFIVNSYPNYAIMPVLYRGAAATDEGQASTSVSAEDIVPEFRDRKAGDVSKETELVNTVGCDEVAYFEPVNPENFITIASISMDDTQAEVEKQVIMGSGQSVYASLSNIYIAETNYPMWMAYDETNPIQPTETTLIHKFALSNGQITHIGHMEAPGHILNQFSMDEYDSHFRIATTISETWSRMGQEAAKSKNNVYIFGDDLKMTGKIEDIAPGESIYSARFMGARGYLVTFKRVDPLFVLDLSDPSNPQILGKLKIPGYSDYLHPYDENHIIGIGKEVDESIDADKVHESDAVYYTAIQGVKIAIFDVTDVANPVEMHKVVIGDRGTDSYALSDHKAFLFDKEKNLLVVPILLAQISEKQKEEGLQQGWLPDGEYTYQGAYVYDLTLENGFQLKGRVTHYDDNQTFQKAGYYYFGDDYSVKRSLYIDNILYTISGMKIKLNSLDDVSEIKQLVFTKNVSQSPGPIEYLK
ncbi:MAG: beta-propeller domain-containing protein [Candidatus Aenigmarchaeota archaeon]|nr:beta-propeller domain-containing protein [Candidatus Aenigmarchaeota archaeon]